MIDEGADYSSFFVGIFFGGKVEVEVLEFFVVVDFDVFHFHFFIVASF